MKLEADFCVVGGGMAGLCAALAAARHGLKTVLLQDRSMLGGNASSEVRMHICGALGKNRRETGILEEIFLDNLRYNASASWPVFDTVLWAKAQYQKNLTLLVDAPVSELTMDGARIRSVRAWRSTTEEWLEVTARYFADCSGDAVLAPLSGAAFRMGREGRSEFGESEAPEQPDTHTMGNSILLQASEFQNPQPFTPFPWAYDYSKPDNKDRIKERGCDVRWTNLWWIEVGGMGDAIKDTANHREELLKIGYGVWDYIKNHSPIKEEMRNFGLEWVGMLPAKRESRRCIGDHILTQNEVVSGGPFDDTVAYGGWKIDNHYPEGFYHHGDGTKYTNCPSPFPIPYRCLYSRNIENLFFAGRNISCSHVAMSATRVMGTCAIEGQAIGSAAAIAAEKNITPREVGTKHIAALQAMLQEDDAFIPGKLRTIPEPCASAQLCGGGEEIERLRDGMERDYDDGDHGWWAALGESATYRFTSPQELHEVRIIFDSNINRHDEGRPFGCIDQIKQGRYFRALQDPCYAPPTSLVKSFLVEAQLPDGSWKTLAENEDNFQRLVRFPVSCTAQAIRLTPRSTWGDAKAHVFAFDAR